MNFIMDIFKVDTKKLIFRIKSSFNIVKSDISSGTQELLVSRSLNITPGFPKLEEWQIKGKNIIFLTLIDLTPCKCPKSKGGYYDSIRLYKGASADNKITLFCKTRSKVTKTKDLFFISFLLKFIYSSPFKF